MNCIIVEDEHNAADQLEYLLQRIRPDIKILAKTDSVRATVLWLNSNKADLIFMDVELGDGICFSIFDQVEVLTPVIFTTSYHQYAIQAFKVNSLSYLLKPIDENELEAALAKYNKLVNPDSYLTLASTVTKYQKKFLVESGNVLHSFSDEDISYFMVQQRHVFIVLANGQRHIFNQTMDALESRLDPAIFFRINRQFIIQRRYIYKMSTETRGRVKLEMEPQSKDEMIVSVDRASGFKEWLKQ